jgi:hypothetical protein
MLLTRRLHIAGDCHAARRVQYGHRSGVDHVCDLTTCSVDAPDNRMHE